MTQRVFTQTFGVVGAIIEKDGLFLLVQENKDSAAGKWNQPAGWIDVGEHPIDAVKREVKEETGFDFKPTGLIGIYSIVKQYNSSEKIMHHGIKLIFRGTVSGEPMQPTDEIAALKWFTRQEIDAMDNTTLRDMDIKLEISDYNQNKSFPLEILRHNKYQYR